jgi:hypothetical protein
MAVIPRGAKRSRGIHQRRFGLTRRRRERGAKRKSRHSARSGAQSRNPRRHSARSGAQSRNPSKTVWPHAETQRARSEAQKPSFRAERSAVAESIKDGLASRGDAESAERSAKAVFSRGAERSRGIHQRRFGLTRRRRDRGAERSRGIHPVIPREAKPGSPPQAMPVRKRLRHPPARGPPPSRRGGWFGVLGSPGLPGRGLGIR